MWGLQVRQQSEFCLNVFIKGAEEECGECNVLEFEVVKQEKDHNQVKDSPNFLIFHFVFLIFDILYNKSPSQLLLKTAYLEK